MACLNSLRFDDAEGCGGDSAGEHKCVASNRFLYSSTVRWHASPKHINIKHVDQTDRWIRLAGDGEHLDDGESVRPAHRFPAALQDDAAFRIGPIV